MFPTHYRVHLQGQPGVMQIKLIANYFNCIYLRGQIGSDWWGFLNFFFLCLEILFYMLREYRRYAFLLFNLHPVGVLFLLFFFFFVLFLSCYLGICREESCSTRENCNFLSILKPKENIISNFGLTSETNEIILNISTIINFLVTK